MKLDIREDRIYIVPENETDKKNIARVLPNASNALIWYTLDYIDSKHPKSKNNHALVIASSVEDYNTTLDR